MRHLKLPEKQHPSRLGAAAQAGPQRIPERPADVDSTFVGALHSNLDALLHKLDITVSHYPWVQMVLLSELATTGPLTHQAQPPTYTSTTRRVMAVWTI